MNLNELITLKNKSAKRLGRGSASGKGTTAGRGTKGQKSRSGYNMPRRFEGGQMPLIQRLPKNRGFHSMHEKPQVVRISAIEKKFKDGDKVNPDTLLALGLIKNIETPVKIVADKKVEKKFKFLKVALSKKLLPAIAESKKAEAKTVKKSK